MAKGVAMRNQHRLGPKLKEREYDDKFHAQHRAWGRIKSGVSAGRLPNPRRLKCVDCGKRASEYDHYLGYSDEHALDVQAVCKSCHHKRAHRRGETNQRLLGQVGPVMKDGHFKSCQARHGKDTNNRLSRIRIGPRTKDGRFVTAHGRYR